MDNPIAESSTPLDTVQAGNLFSTFLEPVEKESKEAEETPEQAAERLVTEEQEAPEASEESEAPETEAQETPRYTVKIDGQEVEVTLDELRNGYSRQADYTKKTMELSQQRQSIEQSAAAINAERQQYMSQLAMMQNALGQALGEQQNINWNQLLESDPVEYLKQKHLFEQRQAAFQRASHEQQRLQQQAQQNEYQHLQARIQTEQQELLAKLPEWKDEAKAKAEKDGLRKYLEQTGYQSNEIDGVTDHRAVIMARKAMLYDNLMQRAQTATKKVANLPPKVERPGNGEVRSSDGRTDAMKRLNKSGSIDDAAAVFARLF